MTEVCFKRTMQLDHITIVAGDCRRLRDFFVEVAGMQDGPRPPFAVAGHWLYLGHKAVLHLIERPSPSGAPVVQSRESAARIDHLALRVDSAAQWEQLLLRLAERAIAFQVAPPNAGEERQLFVMPAPGVRVEFVIARQHLAGYG